MLAPLTYQRAESKLAYSEYCTIAANIANRGNQLCRWNVLQNVAAGANLQAFEKIVFVVVHGQENDFGFSPILLDLSSCFKAAQAGHADVHEHDIRPCFRSLVDRISTVGGLTNHFHIRLCGDESANTLAEQGMVVGQQKSNFCHKNVTDKCACPGALILIANKIPKYEQFFGYSLAHC